MENDIPIFLQNCLGQTQLELISIHIPKTAGTAFFHHLKDVYSDESVIRLDVNQRKKTIFLNQKPWEETNSLDPVKVVHGHFSAQILKKSVPDLLSKMPIITWLRDPVERIVSNYLYLVKRLTEELKEEERGINILSKMQRSLLEYARLKHNRNVQTRYFMKTKMDELFFIGIQEHYKEDLLDLSQLMGWPKLQVRKLNVTGTRYDLSPVERAEIEALNQLDIAFYQEALARRTTRRAQKR